MDKTKDNCINWKLLPGGGWGVTTAKRSDIQAPTLQLQRILFHLKMGMIKKLY